MLVKIVADRDVEIKDMEINYLNKSIEEMAKDKICLEEELMEEIKKKSTNLTAANLQQSPTQPVISAAEKEERC